MAGRGTESVDADRVRRARREFVDAQRQLEDASSQLREVLERVEATTRRGRAHIEAGLSAVDLPVVAEIGALRAELAERMAAFDHARMETRLANMRLAVWEGSSASEIARRYGVSRQYVSKLLKEAEGDGDRRTA